MLKSEKTQNGVKVQRRKISYLPDNTGQGTDSLEVSNKNLNLTSPGDPKAVDMTEDSLCKGAKTEKAAKNTLSVCF